MEELLNEREAGKFLHVSQGYLKRRRAKGLAPRFVRLSTKAIRYRVADLQEFVQSRSVEPGQERGAVAAVGAPA